MELSRPSDEAVLLHPPEPSRPFQELEAELAFVQEPFGAGGVLIEGRGIPSERDGVG